MEATPESENQALTWRGSLLARLPGGRRSYWVVVAVAAAITGLAVAAMAARASGNSSLGQLTLVVVATGAIEAGEPLSADNTEVRQYPALVLPEGALAALVGDEIASTAIHAGEVITEARLGGLLIGDRTELAIPAHTALPPLVPGDRVDVLVTLRVPDDRGGHAQATLTVATAAVVTNTAEHATTIAVTAQELLPVATAIVEGSVTLALVQAG